MAPIVTTSLPHDGGEVAPFVATFSFSKGGR